MGNADDLDPVIPFRNDIIGNNPAVFYYNYRCTRNPKLFEDPIYREGITRDSSDALVGKYDLHRISTR
ncbi:MAG: hypothetical protein A4E39_01200 [Methanoregulaceae archaeon PtaB.Bin152]|nr:MAG: hypothetical protein A4E39_01200 [Methanoregulaceae archaeon PtaB.Bin152]